MPRTVKNHSTTLTGSDWTCPVGRDGERNKSISLIDPTSGPLLRVVGSRLCVSELDFANSCLNDVPRHGKRQPIRP